MNENTGRTSEKFVRLDQDRTDVKSDLNGRGRVVSVRRLGEAISGRFWQQVEIWLRVEVY